jgi:hypothetical protein
MAMSWCTNLNNEKHECLVIEFVGVKYFMNQHCLATCNVKPMCLMLDLPLVPLDVGSCETMVSKLCQKNYLWIVT